MHGVPLLIRAMVCWIAGLSVAALFARTLESVIQRASSVGIVGAAVAVVVIGMMCFVAARAMRGDVLGPRLACSALFVAGVVAGRETARHRAWCLGALSNESATLEVAIDSRAAPHAFVRGEAHGIGALAHCRVPASVQVSEGAAEPGDIVVVVGTRTTTERALKLEGEVRSGSRRARLRAWRGRAGETLDSLFGPRAALARALLIADQDGIEPSVRDRFADAGLIHILSISGLHVALIAGALSVLAGALRLPRAIGAFASLTIITLYVAALGAPPPAVRSAVMLATMTLVSLIQRPVHPWTALALGAAIPTWRPDVVVDLGWQLSVSGMASLVAARATMRRIRNSTPRNAKPTDGAFRSAWQIALQRSVRWLKRLDGWRWTLVRELFTGVVASIVTAPLVAWYFGRVSLVAPLSNIFAGPVIGFLQPALFLAFVLSPWPALAKLAASACTVPMFLLDRIAMVSAHVPMAALHVAPTMATAVCLGTAAALMVRATASRKPARLVLWAAVALTIGVWLPIAPTREGALELHMIDVGQGDALAIRTPRGRWILIDAGRSWNGGDAGRRVVVPYVRRLGGEIAAFVLSHPHDDHVGGAASVITALHPELWWEPAYVGTSPTYRSALIAVQREHVPWHRAHPGDTLRIDGVLLRVLAPDSTWTTAQEDPNLASVVVAIEYKHVRWLFTGDAEAEEEQWMLERWGHDALRSSVLKAGHHGSRTSSTSAFLDAVRPDLAIISVGADNRYGHPSPSVLQEFERRSVRALRTDLEGAIVVRTNGVTQEVETARGRWSLPPP